MKTIRYKIKENEICSKKLAEQTINKLYKNANFETQTQKTNQTLIKLILIGKNWQNKESKITYFFKENLTIDQKVMIKPRLHHNFFKGFYFK